MQTNYERLATDFLRALRGKRSQLALSRRLGYRSNIAYRWETARCFPTAFKTLEALDRLGHEPVARLRAFLQPAEPHFLRGARVKPALVPALLSELRGGESIKALAARSGFSRYQLTRWCSGSAEPRLPEWLALIDVLSHRLLDFVASFFEPESLPSLSTLARRRAALLEAAYDAPWSHAILRCLELSDYAALRRHEPGWLAARIGIAASEEERALALLAAAGQVRWDGARYQIADTPAIDARRDPERARALRAFWIEQARSRLLDQQPGFFGYNLFSVSERDFERIRELHLQYYKEVQAIVSASAPGERVGLFCTQLLALDAKGERRGG